MSADELRKQLLADSDDEEKPAVTRTPAAGSSMASPAASTSGYTHGQPTPADAYYAHPTPADFATNSPAVAANDDKAERAGRAAAAAVDGLDALMSAAGLEDRLSAAGLWCVEHGWCSVAHLRSGGSRAADAFVTALRLKPDGARGRKLKKELKKDVWAWDMHAAAARSASKRPEQ